MGQDRGNSSSRAGVEELLSTVFTKRYQLQNAEFDEEYGKLLPHRVIPQAQARRSVEVNAQVKLGFSINDDLDRKEETHPAFTKVRIEFLWVAIIATPRYTPYDHKYRGVLITNPRVHRIQAGTLIHFEPRHIYEIAETHKGLI